MTYQGTKELESIVNKGQRQVIVAILAKAKGPLSAEELTKRCQATGNYNGKGTKGHVNKWAMAKAGGDLGSIKYHLRALIAEGRVKELNEAAPKREKKAKKVEAVAEAAVEKLAEDVAEDARETEEVAA